MIGDEALVPNPQLLTTNHPSPRQYTTPQSRVKKRLPRNEEAVLLSVIARQSIQPWFLQKSVTTGIVTQLP